MGHMTAIEITNATELSLRQQLKWHLTGNHFPPIPLEMIDPAKKAIDACNEDDYDRIIETPFPHRKYGTRVPAWSIIKNLHLEEWLNQEGE